MIGMTRTMSKELVSRGVTVNAVAPGFIASEMTAELGEVEIRRHGSPLRVIRRALQMQSAIFSAESSRS